MKRVITVILAAALLVSVVSMPVSAAVDSADVLIKLLVEKGLITEDEASAVRAEVATIRQDEEASKKSFAVSGKRPIKLGGYIQERYIHSYQANSNDTLETRRARLQLGGDATEVVDFKVQVDFAGSRKAVSSVDFPGSKTSTGLFSKPTLLDAVIGYKLAGESKLSVGQFKIPFSLENLTSSTNLDFINRSQVVEALVPGRDIGAQGRDVGVQFSSLKNLDQEGIKQLEYYAGIFNGAGINIGDDNDRKDPALRLVFRPGVEGLSLGVSHYNGAVGSNRLDHVRTGGEASYYLGPWSLKSEYIAGKDGSVRKKGWYASLVRTFSPAIQGALRFDRLDPDTNLQDNAVSTATLGLNWFLNKDGYTRWQVNYERRREEGQQIKNDQLLAQFQAGF